MLRGQFSKTMYRAVKKRIITNFTIKMMHDYKHDCMLSPSGLFQFALFCNLLYFWICI